MKIISKYFFSSLILFLAAGIVSAGTPNPFNVSKLSFDENKNQWPSLVKYHVEIPGINLWLENNALTYLATEKVDFHGFGKTKMEPITVHYHAWKVKFENSNPNVAVLGRNPYSGVNNYYLGNDKSKWAENVNVFEKVKYENIYSGIDINFYGSNNNIKYDFIVNPNADYKKIKLSYDGPDELHIEYGHLYIKTSLGTLIEQKPFAYQEINGEKKEIVCKFVLKGNNVNYSGGSFDKKPSLNIEPTLFCATYTSSTADNWGYTATYDAAGNIYSAGIVAGAGYPVSSGAFQSTFGGGGFGGNNYPFDIGIIKYNPTGTARIFATYYGGSDNEQPHSMFVNANDELYIAGRTYSTNFPVTAGAYSTTNKGAGDIIVGKFSGTGALLASTYIGGTGDDGVNYTADFYTFGKTKFNYADDGRSELILDANSNVYVAASTQSTNFPTSGTAYQKNLSGTQDGIVFEMNSSLSSLVFSTYLGGNDYDAAYGLKLDNSGNICVTGGTTSNNFPTTAGVIHPTFQGGAADGFISILNPLGSSLIASTFIGTVGYDQSFLVEIDMNNDIYVFGQTMGAYPVTAGTYSNANSGQFIHKLNSSLSATVFSTVVGSGLTIPNISPTAFLVDSCQSIYIAGWGRCTQLYNPNPNTVTGMPITANAQQSTTDGCDFYFMVLTPNAKKLWYATFYGENGGEPDHVDGGTSRFDRRAFIYESCCASCGGSPSGFPVTSTAFSTTNNSTNCNNAVVKMDISIHPVAKANLNGPNKGCAPFTANFNNTGSAGSNYIWNFGDGSPISTNISASHTYTSVGTYTVTLYAIDSLGICKYIDSSKVVISVGKPPVLSTAQTNPLCFGGKNGTATVTANGGLNPITYLWTPSSQSSQTASGLAAGNYTITVVDSLGCKADTSVTIAQPPQLTGSIVATTNVSCPGGKDGSATSAASGGTGTISYSWNTTPVQASPSASNLAAGNYSVTFTDANGCTASQTVAITEPPPMTMTNTFTPSGCGMSNGTATANPSGGQTPYTYLWLTTPAQMTQTATGLSVGTHTVIIVDSKGCSQTFIVSVPGATPPIADFTYSPFEINFLSPNVDFSDLSVNHPVYWQWNFGDPNSGVNDSSYQQNPSHIFSDTGNYCIKLIIFDSSRVCRDTIVKCLRIEADFTFYIPNCFTPNNDDINDMFFGKGTYIKHFHMWLFDRWGNLMWQCETNGNPQDSPDCKWNGKVEKGHSNKTVQEDVYVWKVDLTDVKNNEHHYVGHFSKVK